MKRLFLLIAVVMLVYWVWASHRWAHLRQPEAARWNGPHYAQDREARRHRVANTGDEVRQALQEAGHEIRHSVGEVRDEVHHAIDELRGALLSDNDDRQRSDAEPRVVEREEAEGLPVRIVPGTRVTDAQAVPPVPGRTVIKSLHPRGLRPEKTPVVKTGTAEIPMLEGEISATPERADADAYRKLRETITAWLDPDVPSSWSPPGRELDSIVLATTLQTVEKKEYGPMYITHLKLDTTPERRARLVKLFNRELVAHRLVNLGGSLAFILMCLAAVSGYIRADEATKGYYTNRLRMLAAAGVGAGGVLIYQMLA